jgi:hypothetical protein
MPTLSSFDYAVIRVVPRVDREEFVNAGVILFCRTRRYLGARVALDRSRLAALAPDMDADEVDCRLALIPLIAAGNAQGGEIAALLPWERFHWLVAPKSTVLQVSSVHTGLCYDPELTLVHLFQAVVPGVAAEGGLEGRGMPT